ncbi:UDP-4-amino-4,6-dideoxy-N-acetyl-beta-L-altrosamine transaminase [Paenibacillus humicola]|uniref:UDP-4-amino-4, 6-dideoxy-N-acetyl-beta-L-altrosamine transaminase n=1 Tax=Paenibacillus humicola TaxID=3110540 RepID=UPI00237C12B8|nr:UDP-4-amino-4,6-dideoxy-N-acetyl-beta-L-altrosamine transaminase [Paenibacillus humicola]
MAKLKHQQLAILGGEPVRETLLPYGRQWIDEADIEAVVETLKSPFLTQGPKIKAFEEAVAGYAGAKYAVAFSNGTAALHGACFAAGIGEGDEAITTPMTFAASANCVRYCGGNVVFADIEPDTYNIDVNRMKALIGKRTKAVIPVDFTGQPADLDEIMETAKTHNLIVIEDAAHSIGAVYKNRRVGSIADMTMFSFHPVKHVTSGEGGVIVTDSEHFYERLLLFRSHGITRNRDMMHNTGEGEWYYEMHELGFNYRMTDIQAALGLSQLRKLNEFTARRRQIASRYTELLSSIPGIVLPYQKQDRQSSWHLYIIRLELDRLSADRNMIFAALRKENIGVNVHYVPVHLHPYYRRLGCGKGLAPAAESVYEGFITLPLFPAMTETDILDVVSAVEKVIGHYAK